MKKEYRLYNILFPLWMLIWLPTWLWLFLIPANYLIDYAVFRRTMAHLKIKDYVKKARKHAWKICLIGFLSDLVGAVVLLETDQYLYGKGTEASHTIASNIAYNPFGDIYSFLIVMLVVALSGTCIYFFNSLLLKRDRDLDEKQIHRIALNLALITAPYLFLFPSYLLYH
ncbi:MAG: hypothetical protein K6G61_00760 [Solobacterium sp.]|nr:hypothetical protein [Solobacterium sp.]